jgi:hypothetical protein
MSRRVVALSRFVHCAIDNRTTMLQSKNMEDQYQKADGQGYKSSWKKWLWIYIVIGLVVYGAIYFYYAGKNNDSATPGQNNSIY